MEAPRPPRPAGTAPSAAPRHPNRLRNRLSGLAFLSTAVVLGFGFFFDATNAFLMPGSLTSAHGTIETCATCHTRSGNGGLGWLHGLIAGDPRADSQSCLTCHDMPKTAFEAHGVARDRLKGSRERLARTAARMEAPLTARAQSLLVPRDDMNRRGVFCATCHQEHQGADFDITRLSNEQCRSCHVLKFDSFDNGHPEFSDYPFTRRTRIIYDHAAHFGKHFPEVSRKDPERRIPSSCATCHDNSDNGAVMAVAPFEKTCSACHLGQINGKERATGPKGIAFLALPELDTETLASRKRPIGEWPNESGAALTPFMKAMISRSEHGRSILDKVSRLDLQDLAKASDDDIEAVVDLVWEIKALVFSLISGKASDVLGDLQLARDETMSADLVSDLTASLPRDVLVSAQQQWLPNLAAEIASGRYAVSRARLEESTAASRAAEPSPGAADHEPPNEPTNEPPNEEDEKPPAPEDTGSPDPRPPATAARNPQACLVRVFGQCLLTKPGGGEADGQPSASNLGGAFQAGLADVGPPPDRVKRTAKPEPAIAKPGGAPVALPAPVEGTGTKANPSDDLLFPSPQEQREIDAHRKKAGRQPNRNSKPSQSAGSGSSTTRTAQSPPESRRDSPRDSPTAGATDLQGDVDPETWAEHGGWYRQDHALYYRPAAHEDRFISTWLKLTAAQPDTGLSRPLAEIFDVLAAKDAQGSCRKCHSVDSVQGTGRRMNFSPLTAADKKGRFTRFDHEPHFAVAGDRGCSTCHELQKDRPYLKGYDAGDPATFVPEFGAIRMDTCRGCHTAGKARQDCLHCHGYHVGGVHTPPVSTRLEPPRQ